MYEIIQGMKRVQEKKSTKGDANATVASRRTGKRMPRGGKRVASDVETSPFAQELNHGGALTLRRKEEGEISARGSGQSALLKGLERKAGPRRTEGARLKLKARGRKRAWGDADTDPASHEVDLEKVQSRDAVPGKSFVVSEDCCIASTGPVSKTQEAAKPTVSGKGRPSKRCKLDTKIQLVKMSCAVKETCQAGPNVEVRKVGLVACEKGGDSARCTPIKWKLELRPALKKILERDRASVVKQGKRHRLPASPNIIQLLDRFVKDASLRHLSALEKLQSK